MSKRVEVTRFPDTFRLTVGDVSLNMDEATIAKLSLEVFKLWGIKPEDALSIDSQNWLQERASE